MNNRVHIHTPPPTEKRIRIHVCPDCLDSYAFLPIGTDGTQPACVAVGSGRAANGAICRLCGAHVKRTLTRLKRCGAMNCEGMLNGCPIRHAKICGFILLQSPTI
jgi:hypothetical protein